MEWAAVIAGVLTLAGLLLKVWLTGAPGRKKEAANEAIQQGREDIQAGNADAVTARLGRVLDDQAATGDCDAGSKSGVSDTGPTSIADRLSAFDISIDKTPGSS